jgi:hypothetical protein
VRRDGDTSNYFVELRNTNGQDSQARVDVSGWQLPTNSTRVSSSMWVRFTNFENMRIASRFVTNQRESLNARNQSDRTLYTLLGPVTNTRSAFGNSVDLRVRMLVFNQTANPSRNYEMETRAYNRILFPNRWHHVASVYNNGTLILYLDTVEVGRSTAAGCTHAVFPTGAMSIGAVAPGPVPQGYNATAFGTVWEDAGLTGHMDDIRLYDQVLNKADLIAVYNGYDAGFMLTSNNTQPVLSMPPWLMDIATSNQSMYSNVYRRYVAPGNDTFWKVTASLTVANAWVRGNPFNETLAEVAAMPFSPTALNQGVSPINEYYLLFDHNFSAFPAKPATLPGRQFAIGLGHNNTIINFNNTQSKTPILMCRTFNLMGFGGDTNYPTFQSWAQFDSSQCRAPNASGLVRMAIKFALPNDSTLDAVVYQFVADPFEVILPRYQTFELPFANTDIATLPMGGSETTETPVGATTVATTSTSSTAGSTTSTLRDLGTTFNASTITPLQATEFVGINLALLIAGVLLGCTLLAMALLKIRRRFEHRTVHRSNRNSIALTRHEAIELDRHITSRDMLDRLDRTMQDRELRTVQSAPNLGGSMASAHSQSGRFGHGSTFQLNGSTLQSSGNTILGRSGAPRNALELDDDEAVDPKFI